MFSGLIKTTGLISHKTKTRLGVDVSGLSAKLGDSVAINGVCLTVSNKTQGKKPRLFFDLSQETLKKTTLQQLKLGDLVNVEPALKMADSLGGHIVQGHVDGVGRVTRILNEDTMKKIFFEAPQSIMQYVVSKGSMTVDGVSLTTVDISSREFSVALIPYTLEHTNLHLLKKGDSVNLEADIIGKYVSKYLKK